jgi:hypothetical protein
LARRLAAIDLEPWTDTQAKEWWTTTGARPQRPAVVVGDDSVTREVSIAPTSR